MPKLNGAQHLAGSFALENLPFGEFELNAVWLELSLIAQDLTAWTQSLCLARELAVCEPKRFATGCCTRRPALLPNPPRRPSSPSQLAIGTTARCRVRAPPCAPPARRLTTGLRRPTDITAHPLSHAPQASLSRTPPGPGSANELDHPHRHSQTERQPSHPSTGSSGRPPPPKPAQRKIPGSKRSRRTRTATLDRCR
jgi:hypothetical protein